MRVGDEAEFQAFAVACTSQLFRTALLLSGGDWHRAEDLVQETLAKVCLAWRKVDKSGNPAGYAQTTLVRTFVSQKRLKSAGEVPVADPPPASASASSLPSASAEEWASSLRVTLLEALASLPPRDRAVLVLRYWEDRTADEAAVVLGTNGAAVRAQCKRALAKLRGVLGDVFPELIAG